METFFGTSPTLMVYAFSLTLKDDVILAQRGILEILLLHFPLKYSLFEDDSLVMLCSAALGVVLRRDISLTRRIYAWFLGTVGTSTDISIANDTLLSENHFEMYACQPVFKALKVSLIRKNVLQGRILYVYP